MPSKLLSRFLPKRLLASRESRSSEMKFSQSTGERDFLARELWPKEMWPSSNCSRVSQLPAYFEITSRTPLASPAERALWEISRRTTPIMLSTSLSFCSERDLRRGSLIAMPVVRYCFKVLVAQMRKLVAFLELTR